MSAKSICCGLLPTFGSIYLFCLIFSPSQAFADSSFIVDAMENSLSGGTPLATITVNAGQTLIITATGSWDSGVNNSVPYPRVSDANGLSAYPLYTYNNHSFKYGSLVGYIDTNGSSADVNPEYFLIGTNYSGLVANTGTLKLLYWDSNSYDNGGSVTAHVSAVPIPGTALLLGSSLLGLVGIGSRKKKA